MSTKEEIFNAGMQVINNKDEVIKQMYDNFDIISAENNITREELDKFTRRQYNSLTVDDIFETGYAMTGDTNGTISNIESNLEDINTQYGITQEDIDVFKVKQFITAGKEPEDSRSLEIFKRIGSSLSQRQVGFGLGALETIAGMAQTLSDITGIKSKQLEENIESYKRVSKALSGEGTVAETAGQLALEVFVVPDLLGKGKGFLNFAKNAGLTGAYTGAFEYAASRGTGKTQEESVSSAKNLALIGTMMYAPSVLVGKIVQGAARWRGFNPDRNAVKAMMEDLKVDQKKLKNLNAKYISANPSAKDLPRNELDVISMAFFGDKDYKYIKGAIRDVEGAGSAVLDRIIKRAELGKKSISAGRITEEDIRQITLDYQDDVKSVYSYMRNSISEKPTDFKTDKILATVDRMREGIQISENGANSLNKLMGNITDVVDGQNVTRKTIANMNDLVDTRQALNEIQRLKSTSKQDVDIIQNLLDDMDISIKRSLTPDEVKTFDEAVSLYGEYSKARETDLFVTATKEEASIKQLADEVVKSFYKADPKTSSDLLLDRIPAHQRASVEVKAIQEIFDKNMKERLSDDKVVNWFAISKELKNAKFRTPEAKRSVDLLTRIAKKFENDPFMRYLNQPLAQFERTIAETPTGKIKQTASRMFVDFLTKLGFTQKGSELKGYEMVGNLLKQPIPMDKIFDKLADSTKVADYTRQQARHLSNMLKKVKQLEAPKSTRVVDTEVVDTVEKNFPYKTAEPNPDIYVYSGGRASTVKPEIMENAINSEIRKTQHPDFTKLGL